MTNSQTNASKVYVSQLKSTGAFDDGYSSVEPVSKDTIFAQQKMVPALYLSAWAAAYADFIKLSDLSDEQKQLKHYKIGFAETTDHFLIVFQALLLPDLLNGRPRGVLRTTLGQSLRYLVNKQDGRVSDIKYYR